MKLSKLSMRFSIPIAALAGLVLASAASLSQVSAEDVHADMLQTVMVSGDHLRLSDLLSPNAAGPVRAAAAAVELGRAPEPGSFRVLSAAQLREAIGNHFAINVPAEIIVHRRGYPISAEQIMAAMVEAKLLSAPVSLTGEPETRTPGAALHVTAVLPGLTSCRSLVRFACRDRAACAPFWGEIAIAIQRPASLVQNSRIVTHRAALVTPAHAALLICEEPGMEVRLRVRPLKSAALGEQVRVVDPTTHRIFFAQVKAENLVESNLKEAR